ncbi:GxxExxY protein [Ereboglobus sp. PH5-5]|uniref:GxxExxY protein n=1 Tax=Ereboglobus sp. PH5-5 TaxID=2940529 RepID=UPI002406DD7E|nr:GxxExxY protein [Ereboglobus sp. PH5-5]MDF9833669.1 GxxExxY protein [Ereboglobus sp. PH5-5]
MSLDRDDLAGRVIGAAIAVHKHLGPGLLEPAYETCLAIELRHLGIPFERQKILPITYRDEDINDAYRIDFVINNELILELKAVETLMPIHTAQTLTHLRLANIKTALLINFNVPLLRDGIKRLSL